MNPVTCIDCGIDLRRPVEKFANYVRSPRHEETEEVEVVYAMVHTEETLARLDVVDDLVPEKDRQALAAEMAAFDADDVLEINDGSEVVGNTETAKTREVDFSIPVDLFVHVEVETPNVVNHDDDVAYTYVVREDRPVQKTGLVCRDCYDSAHDEVIWGPDKPE